MSKSDSRNPDDPSQDAEPPFVQPPLKAKKGRGAVSNLQGRYETLIREDIDDGWSSAGLDDRNASSTIGSRMETAADLQPPTELEPSTEANGASAWKTQIIEEQAKSILSRNQSPDVPFSISLNPYRGCEHGCI